MGEAARPIGRPRNADADRAIRDAALVCLVEEGYSGMSLDRVAARAGVGRATIYRRWPSKAELVVDAMSCQQVAQIDEPDSGGVRLDLELYLTQVQDAMWAEHRSLRALQVESYRNPDLAEAFRVRFLAQRRAAADRILRRGIARGELGADVDLELIGQAGPAILWHRMSMLAQGPDPELPRRIVAMLIP